MLEISVCLIGSCLSLDFFRHSFSNLFTKVELTPAKSEYQGLGTKPVEVNQKQNFFQVLQMYSIGFN